jgi:hypothetical protein
MLSYAAFSSLVFIFGSDRRQGVVVFLTKEVLLQQQLIK